MGINHTAFVFMLFCLAVLITSSSDGNSVAGEGLEQNIREGHGNSDGGGSGHGDGNGDSMSSTQPGRPLNGAGAANNHNHHRKGAATNIHSCNVYLLVVAISLSLVIQLGLKQ